MRKHSDAFIYQDYFEYHGNTAIKRTRKKADSVVSDDWLMFDSAEEAMEYFNTRCGEFIAPRIPAWMIQDDAPC